MRVHKWADIKRRRNRFWKFKRWLRNLRLRYASWRFTRYLKANPEIYAQLRKESDEIQDFAMRAQEWPEWKDDDTQT